MSKYARLIELKGSLIISRLPNFHNFYCHVVWSSKRTHVCCEIYGLRINNEKSESNYILGQGFATVGYLDSKPGRNLPRLQQIALLRAWINTLQMSIKKSKW